MLATYVGVKYFKFKQTEFEDPATGLKTKRISTVLILLFIIPSIWSAVTLIQRTNFETSATAFIEHSKAYNKSIIYDYKIDHTDGSKLELFFTGEPLNDSTKEIIYKTAQEFDINEEEIIINDHAKAKDLNDIELVKGIYDKMDVEIQKRNDEIRKLREELKAAKGDDIPFVQVTRELINSYPSVKEVLLGQGARVESDSLSVHPCITVIVKCDTLLSGEQKGKLGDWLKIRLNSEDVSLIVTGKE
jgi:hypothetical protein